mmetsp:Transcript_15825/g.39138  ORF Transcript_15825/g.39138 Transcript_15825/m.39138 type:complete len:387 (+) Transcript_15825:600-1760(+)
MFWRPQVISVAGSQVPLQQVFSLRPADAWRATVVFSLPRMLGLTRALYLGRTRSQAAKTPPPRALRGRGKRPDRDATVPNQLRLGKIGVCQHLVVPGAFPTEVPLAQVCPDVHVREPPAAVLRHVCLLLFPCPPLLRVPLLHEQRHGFLLRHYDLARIAGSACLPRLQLSLHVRRALLALVRLRRRRQLFRIHHVAHEEPATEARSHHVRGVPPVRDLPLVAPLAQDRIIRSPLQVPLREFRSLVPSQEVAHALLHDVTVDHEHVGRAALLENLVRRREMPALVHDGHRGFWRSGGRRRERAARRNARQHPHLAVLDDTSRTGSFALGMIRFPRPQPPVQRVFQNAFPERPGHRDVHVVVVGNQEPRVPPEPERGAAEDGVVASPG